MFFFVMHIDKNRAFMFDILSFLYYENATGGMGDGGFYLLSIKYLSIVLFIADCNGK